MTAVGWWLSGLAVVFSIIALVAVARAGRRLRRPAEAQRVAAEQQQRAETFRQQAEDAWRRAEVAYDRLRQIREGRP